MRRNGGARPNEGSHKVRHLNGVERATVGTYCQIRLPAGAKTPWGVDRAGPGAIQITSTNPNTLNQLPGHATGGGRRRQMGCRLAVGDGWSLQRKRAHERYRRVFGLNNCLINGVNAHFYAIGFTRNPNLFSLNWNFEE